MRIKNAGYMIDEGHVQQILQAVRQGGLEMRNALMCAAYQTYSEIADDLYISILYGLSYDYMTTYVREIPLNKYSFYGYRRKVISMLGKMLGYEYSEK